MWRLRHRRGVEERPFVALIYLDHLWQKNKKAPLRRLDIVVWRAQEHEGTRPPRLGVPLNWEGHKGTYGLSVVKGQGVDVVLAGPEERPCRFAAPNL